MNFWESTEPFGISYRTFDVAKLKPAPALVPVVDTRETDRSQIARTGRDFSVYSFNVPPFSHVLGRNSATWNTSIVFQEDTPKGIDSDGSKVTE